MVNEPENSKNTKHKIVPSCATIAIRGCIIVFLLFACASFVIPWLSHWGKSNARHLHCQHKMREIARALESYHNRHGALPPAYSTDEHGNPLHSWRVLILPYLEDFEWSEWFELYENIRLDEPWDSDWNSQFHKKWVGLFHCPSSSSITGHSSYYMVVDEAGKIVPESGILFAERKETSIWMNPNHEIRVADIKDGINSNPAGITSWHVQTSLFGTRTGGANICTLEFEVQWVPEQP